MEGGRLSHSLLNSVLRIVLFARGHRVELAHTELLPLLWRCRHLTLLALMTSLLFLFTLVLGFKMLRRRRQEIKSIATMRIEPDHRILLLYQVGHLLLWHQDTSLLLLMVLLLMLMLLLHS